MKVNYKKTIEVNNELKSIVDRQQDDIKHLNDEDKVQKMPAASNPMKNNKHVCVICNQIFAMEKCFKKHIQEDHMIPGKPMFPFWAY